MQGLFGLHVHEGPALVVGACGRALALAHRSQARHQGMHVRRYASVLKNIIQRDPAYFYQAVREYVRFGMVREHGALRN